MTRYHSFPALFVLAFIAPQLSGCAWIHQQITPHPRRALVLQAEGGAQIGDHPVATPTFRFLWGYRRDGWLGGIGGRATARLTSSFPGRADEYGLESVTWELTMCRLTRHFVFGCGVIAAGSADGFRRIPGHEFYRSFSRDSPVLAFRLRGGLRFRLVRGSEEGSGTGTLHLQLGVDASLYVTRQSITDELGEVWTQGPVGIMPFIGFSGEFSD